MSHAPRCRDRREAWLMGAMSAAMLILPLAAWGAARVSPAIIDRICGGHPRNCLSCRHGSMIGVCRSYCAAQVMYLRNDWNGDRKLEYASQARLLHDQLDTTGQPINLMDQAFAAATVPGGPPHRGYVYQEMQTIAGQPIDWKDDFALCATPAVYGRNGYRTFIVCTNGTVYGKDLGSSRFVTDYPKDPAAEGWTVAE